MVDALVYGLVYTCSLHQLECFCYIIQVPGLADASILISYGVVGSPVLFPTTATYGSTIVR